MKLDLDRIDPELKDGKTEHNALDIRRDNIEKIRKLLEEGLVPVIDVPVLEAEQWVESPSLKTRVMIYRKSNRPNQPCLLWIHGGGYILGRAEDVRAKRFARDLDITVVSVDYRLAPEYPFPAGLEDCWQVLKWLPTAAAALGIDTEQLAIGGASAGAGLAAGLALKSRDAGGPPLKLQLLLYPMIDNLHATASGTIESHPVWKRDTSFAAWEMYLDGIPGANASPYAAASRAKSLEGLPKSYICVGTEDLFFDEDVAYAMRLNVAGVACTLAVWPGVYHAAEGFFPEARVSQRLAQGVTAALADAFGL
ncbi:MAG: alpha/beta hydrolase [Pseudomonadales bacterium]